MGESKITGFEPEKEPKEEDLKTELDEKAAKKKKAQEDREALVASENNLDFAKRRKDEEANRTGWPNWNWEPITPAQKDAAKSADVGIESVETFALLKEGVYKFNPKETKKIAGLITVEKKRFDVALVKNPDGSYTASTIPQPTRGNKTEYIRALNNMVDCLTRGRGHGTIKFKWKSNPHGGFYITREHLAYALAVAEQKGLSVIPDDETIKFLRTLSAKENEYFTNWFKRLEGNQVLNTLGHSTAIDKLTQDLKNADTTEKYSVGFKAPDTLPPNQTVEQMKKDFALTKYKESLEKDDQDVVKPIDDQITSLVAEKEKLEEDLALLKFLREQVDAKLDGPEPLLQNMWQMQDPEKEEFIKDRQAVAEEVAAAIAATKAPPEQAVQSVAATEAMRTLNKPTTIRDAMRHDPTTVAGRIEKYMKDGEPQRDEAIRVIEKVQADLETRRKVVDDKLRGFEDGLSKKENDIDLANQMAVQRAKQTGKEVPPPDSLSDAEKQRKTKVTEARKGLQEFKSQIEQEKSKIDTLKAKNVGFSQKLDQAKEKIALDRETKETGRPILK